MTGPQNPKSAVGTQSVETRIYKLSLGILTALDSSDIGKSIAAALGSSLGLSGGGLALKAGSGLWTLHNANGKRQVPQEELAGLSETRGKDGIALPFSNPALAYLVVESPGKELPSGILTVLGQAVKLTQTGLDARLQTLQRLEKLATIDREVRENDERLRAFFNESSDLVYIANADDVVATVNKAGLAMLGVKDRFDVVGLRYERWMDSPKDRQYFLKRLAREGYVSEYELMIRTAQGELKFCVETAQAVRSKNGAILEVLGIVRDVSMKVAAEREILAVNLELAETVAELKRTRLLFLQHEKLASIGQLSAGIAHEINNPLGFLRSNHTTLLHFIKTIRQAWEQARRLGPQDHDKVAGDTGLDYVFSEIDMLLSESSEGYSRILEIVQNLKVFAREDTADRNETYDLEQGIESTLIIARNEFKYVADIELNLGGVPVIPARGGEINQVLLNLIVNAAQAIAAQKRSTPGKIRITTRLKGDSVFCSVSDDGPGIPEAQRLKVLDPFYTTKEPGAGMGLGLSIAYDMVVNKHGGTFEISESSLGGAKMEFSLPINRAGEQGPTDQQD